MTGKQFREAIGGLRKIKKSKIFLGDLENESLIIEKEDDLKETVEVVANIRKFKEIKKDAFYFSYPTTNRYQSEAVLK